MATLKRILRQVWSGRHIGWRLLRMIVALPIVALVFLMFMENKLIFFPVKYDGSRDWETNPVYVSRDRQATVEDVWFKAEDGTQLHGWLLEPQVDDMAVPCEYAVLFCHGNAGNITDRRQLAAALCRLPLTVFVFDYRGYGRSEGSPNEKGVCLDARAGWDELIRRGWSPDKIIILGVSVGGGPAVELAMHVEPAALVTQSTYTSIPNMAKVAYPFIPRMIVRTQLDNLAKIGKITCPKLLIHGTVDEVIPFSMGEQLAAAADANSEFVPLVNIGHNDVDFSSKPYQEAWQRLFKRIVEGAQSAEKQ